MADSEGPKGQGLLRKEEPPTYAIFSETLVLSRLTRFLKGHSCRAFVEPAFGELLESPLPESFRRAFREPDFGDLFGKKYISKHLKGCLREGACVCVSLLITTNCLFSRKRK